MLQSGKRVPGTLLLLPAGAWGITRIKEGKTPGDRRQ